MKLTVDEARHLSERTLAAAGYTEREAATITEHIMDTELRGLDYGGLARTLSVFCLLYTSPSPRDGLLSRMPSSA